MIGKVRNLELEQAFMRTVLVFFGLVYGVMVVSLYEINDIEMIYVTYFGYVYMFVSVISVLHVYAVPYGRPWRHTVYMCFDLFVTSVMLHSFGENGIPYFIFYLWLTIGNGFRYGYKELILCAALSILGFLFVFLTTSYWKSQLLLSTTAVILLSVIPMYVAIMLKRLQEAKEKAELASREKSRFLANVSHEIRTPLNAIVGFSSMLDKVNDPDEQKRMVFHINNASESLMDLVNDVLDLSRIESGRVQTHEVRVKVRAMMSLVEGMFSQQAAEKGVSLMAVVSENVPEDVYLDKQRVQQVLINLLGNAVKFTETGDISVVVDRDENVKRSPMIRFNVRDTGPGVQNQEKIHIFDRFRQADDSVQRKFGGTGLGTSIARNLVELMGGEIGVDSVFGEGSCFWFTVPLREVGEMELSALNGDRDGLYFLNPPAPDSEMSRQKIQAKVLVAEDSDINRRVYQNMFRLFDVDAVLTDSGSGALELLGAEKFGLIILDLQMPGVSGIDVINAYNEMTEPRSRVPIVVITGDATADLVSECKRLGVSTFIPKPIGIDKMHELLDRYMMLKAGSLA